MKPLIIGINGLAQSGKSTAASFLVDRYSFEKVSFATPLKSMLTALGVDVQDKLSTPPVLCGKTVRHALQTLGTDWGRNLIGGDVWVRAAMAKAEGKPAVVFDDVRFDNEAEAIKEAGGVIWRVTRPGAERMEHASEWGISDSLVDVEISNADDLATLEGKVLLALSALMTKRL